jgi:hypothetical protein
VPWAFFAAHWLPLQ